MQLPLLPLVSLLGLLSGATAHGLVQSPSTRSPGDATAAACGKTMANFYKADNTSYPEALLRANPGGLKDGYNAKNCNLWLCKGYQFGDNKAGVRQYVGGQEVVVLQWYWFGQGQTYESCTDFVVPEATAAADSPIRKREWWA
ncbi:hypothetical protein N0V85_003568 [Neurospora sp. IMI 360204]|nr:hypothetical protein N0V85_003568 [Neurospora sp. IMI 360204]